MKRIISISLLVFLTLIIFTISGCTNSEDENHNLDLAHFFPSTHPVHTQLLEPWADEIESTTDGRIKIHIHPAETLLQADAIYDGVDHKLADIGLSCFSYTRGRFPVSEVFELPGITYESSEVASIVAWEGINKINPQEVQDTKLLMLFTTGPGHLYTKEPVRSLEDLMGMDIRATGLSAKTLTELGANPIPMSQAGAYEALSRGVVKGNLGPIEVLKGWNQANVTQYVTKTPFLYNNVFFITMNKDSWAALDNELQETMLEINEKYLYEVAAGLWDKQNEEALEWIVEEKNMKTFTLTEEEKERWKSQVNTIQDDFVNEMNALDLDGKNILNTVKDLVDKYNN
ncbi:TRAP transporter solute receptor, unknown substrate 3 [Candidatus Syntrophocurvum alkaliphilum]|uniref:TRAP-type C4-dicarboxylate transport system, periplasmic component n=1 Tax=Candidatus Syntrophocurvum alkaliphilum TaxID=2293317 RepID=A0A6I6DK17_9FIRM|nr:TRAP transporter substrate-binding protein [Candidatus Syntrophocurvum alkaliphilum]QGU00407.1 TRAP transporter solute receptor, unknown substrate 3 [Candidatus Syntrophocurvum alkaliphilum]